MKLEIDKFIKNKIKMQYIEEENIKLKKLID